MSHQPERIEKDCLNCGAMVQGRYCQVCGQENIVTKQNFWGLTKHFVYDIFHFDGKFFDTLRYLIFRPGFVPKEYVKGKRNSYLDPIRMYLFTSALFFLIFFAITKPIIGDGSGNRHTMNDEERFEYASDLNGRWKSGEKDSSLPVQIGYLLDSTYKLTLYKDTAASTDADTSYLIRLKDQLYRMEVEKDRSPDSISIHSKSTFLEQVLNKKWKAYKAKYKNDDRELIRHVIDSFMHRLPYILFVSLPFFALLLKLLYLRRKQFYYSDHAVFTLYHYIFSFILLLVYFLFDRLGDWTHSKIIGLISGLILLSGGVYLLISMKKFYGQSHIKTFFKFFLLNSLGLFLVGFLMIIFVLLSVFQL
ncbi:MAG TPA: DUF3667 domain-containing protein [Flavisolibacter sp.]|nr:DUF3667 domain-containing protein [Flavisolibacter sp.]